MVRGLSWGSLQAQALDQHSLQWTGKDASHTYYSTTVDDTVYASSKNNTNLCKFFFSLQIGRLPPRIRRFIMRIRKGFLMERKDSCEECGVCNTYISFQKGCRSSLTDFLVSNLGLWSCIYMHSVGLPFIEMWHRNRYRCMIPKNAHQKPVSFPLSLPLPLSPSPPTPFSSLSSLSSNSECSYCNLETALTLL